MAHSPHAASAQRPMSWPQDHPLGRPFGCATGALGVKRVGGAKGGMTKRCTIGAAPHEARRPWPPARVPAAVSAPAACLPVRPFPCPPISLSAHSPLSGAVKDAGHDPDCSLAAHAPRRIDRCRSRKPPHRPIGSHFPPRPPPSAASVFPLTHGRVGRRLLRRKIALYMLLSSSSTMERSGAARAEVGLTSSVQARGRRPGCSLFRQTVRAKRSLTPSRRRTPRAPRPGGHGAGRSWRSLWLLRPLLLCRLSRSCPPWYGPTARQSRTQ